MVKLIIAVGVLLAFWGAWAGSARADTVEPIDRTDTTTMKKMRIIGRGTFLFGVDDPALESWWNDHAKPRLDSYSQRGGPGRRASSGIVKGRIAARFLPALSKWGPLSILASAVTAYELYTFYRDWPGGQEDATTVQLYPFGSGIGSLNPAPEPVLAGSQWCYSRANLWWYLVVNWNGDLKNVVHPQTTGGAGVGLCHTTTFSADADGTINTTQGTWIAKWSTCGSPWTYFASNCTTAPGSGESWADKQMRYQIVSDQIEIYTDIGTLYELPGFGCLTTGAGLTAAQATCVGRRATQAEMEASLTMETRTDTAPGARSRDYIVPANQGSDGDIANMRAKIKEDSLAKDAVNNVIASGTPEEPNYPDPTNNVLMPSCASLSLASCKEMLWEIGHRGAIVEVLLSRTSAVLTRPAGAVVTTVPGAGATVKLDQEITLRFNPNPLPVALPAPGRNETYSAYTDRLRELGYLGTITQVFLAEGSHDASVGPNAVGTVTTPYTTLLTRAWPAVLPRVWRPDGVTLTINPPTAPPVGPVDGEPDPGPDECPCPLASVELPAVDDACDKFPFGVFCWFGGVVDDLFSVPADAPSLTVVSPGFATEFYDLPEGMISFTLDGDDLPAPFDVFFAAMRTILGFFVWLVGLYFLGRRLLLGSRGDVETGGMPGRDP